jgi:hypothetical protein
MMFTFKHTILVMMLLAGGFVACGDSGSGNTSDTAIHLGQGGALGTGGSGAGGTSVSIDGAAGSGGSQVLDAAAVDTVSVDMSGPVVDALVSEAGSTPVSCTGTKATNLAIINAPPAAGVVAVDVAGGTPPTYDPGTSTCK